MTAINKKNTRLNTIKRLPHRVKGRHPICLLDAALLCLMNYIPTTYPKYCYLPFELVEDAIANNWLDSLAYFCMLKGLFHRPIIYNYSTRRTGALIGVSPATISYHVRVLVSKRLCTLTGGHLRLKSGNQFKSDTKFIVPVGIGTTKQQQVTYLRFVATKRNLHNQSRTFQSKSEALKFHKDEVYSRKQYKAYKKRYKKHSSLPQLESSMQNVLTLSNKSFGSLSNRSASTGIKIQKQFNALCLITSTKRIERISDRQHNRRSFFELCLDASHFLSKEGYIYRRCSNSIEL